MSTDPQNPFGITRDELLNLAAEKIIDQYSEEALSPTAELTKQIKARIDLEIGSTLKTVVDGFMRVEMDKLLRQEIIPVDIWGDKKGPPTTIREQLYRTATKFWDEKVDSDGRVSDGYGTRKRHEFLYQKLVGEAFSEALKTNMVCVIGALKDAIRVDAQKNIDTALNELLRVKSLKEQGL